MMGALLYLHFDSLKNRSLARLKRLKHLASSSSA